MIILNTALTQDDACALDWHRLIIILFVRITYMQRLARITRSCVQFLDVNLGKKINFITLDQILIFQIL